MIIRSFQEAFPHMSIWYKHTSNFCTLVGTTEPLRIDFQSVEQRVSRPDVRAYLARCNVQDVYDLLDSFCCGGDELRQRIGPGLLHRDNHPYLEFHANRPFLAFGYPQTIMFLYDARQPVRPLLFNVPSERAAEIRERLDRWYGATQELIKGGYYAALLETFPLGSDEYQTMLRKMDDAFRRVLQLNPEDKNARFLWGRALACHELVVARDCLAAGKREEMLQHLASATEAAPGTLPAAEARFLYKQATKGPAPR